MKFATMILVIATGVFAVPPLHAQWMQLPQTGSQPQYLSDRTKMVGQTGMGPLLSASLVEPDKNAREHKAVVKVETDSVQLLNPAVANHAPRLDQAHLKFQLDGGAAIDSTSTVMTFTGLAPGKHQIVVKLVGNDNSVWGDEHTLAVDVPK